MPVTAPNAVGNAGKPTSYVQVRFGSKPEVASHKRQVGFILSSGQSQTAVACPKITNSGNTAPDLTLYLGAVAFIPAWRRQP
jgi:hypothetical protein